MPNLQTESQRTCPVCGSKRVRRSRSRGVELFLKHLAVRNYRCGDCNARFRGASSTLKERLLRVAWVVFCAAAACLIIWFLLSRFSHSVEGG